MKEKELVLFMESVHISPVADPGGGARKAPPVYLKTKDRRAEKKFFFGDQPHPAYLGVWNDRPPTPPPPHLISRSGFAAVLHEPSFAHTRKVYVSEFQVKN